MPDLTATVFFLCCYVGKKLLGRSNIRTVAEKRKEKIDEYCQVRIQFILAILNVDVNISLRDSEG